MLSPEEKRLIEREFVARQDEAIRRRMIFRTLFLVGVVSGVGGAAAREFGVAAFLSPILWFAWLVCVAAYVGVTVFPSSSAKDLDARTHLNPWFSALSTLAESRVQLEAIILLAGPYLSRLVFAFVHFAFKS